MTSVGMPGGITQTIGYDTAGRETSIKAMQGTTVLTNYTASYAKPSGQDTELMQTENNVLAGTTNTYSYDGLNRLSDAVGTGTGSNNYTYTYDMNGNRTQYVKNGVASPTYAFNAANELTLSGSSSYGIYDSAGNQTLTGANLGLGYNAKNQTTSFTPSGSSAITASYNDVGQVGRTQIGSTAQLNGLLGLYSDTTGSVATYYTHSATGSGQILGQITGGTAYYYLTDLRGSVVKMTNVSGAVQNTYNYDPYGTLLNSTGSVANAIRYAGGYYDTSIALYKFGARYYNATDARWTQLDPSGQDKGYVYAGDNPVNQVDPTGYLNTDPNQLAASVVQGCAEGAVGSLALAAITTAGTAGAGAPISGAELGVSCLVGAGASYYDTLIGPGGGTAFRLFDAFNALKGFL